MRRSGPSPVRSLRDASVAQRRKRPKKNWVYNLGAPGGNLRPRIGHMSEFNLGNAVHLLSKNYFNPLLASNSVLAILSQRQILFTLLV